MELRNLTTFKEFIFEQSIPRDFSNNTKFSESLVGRGIFSLLRYLKQGVDSLRLEYLKRKLENEYFAGVLRLCALKNINLKDGTMPEEDKKTPQAQTYDEGGDGEIPADERSEYFCYIMNIDYVNMNPINDLKTGLEEQLVVMKEALENIKDDPTQADLKKELENDIEIANLGIKYCDIKLKINLEVFKVLNDTCTTSGMTFSDTQRDIIMALLERVKTFLSTEAREACPTYKLTENEKAIINRIVTCTNPEVKARCNEIIALLAPQPVPTQPQPAQPQTESFDYDEYYSINEEAISSSLNAKVPITQILGDTLNLSGGTAKVNIYEYLKNIGISSVQDINFPALAELWKKRSLMDAATAMTNAEGIKKIQYAASRMIFRVKKTPTYTGITPEKGGGVDYGEDSALRTLWERKIQKVKSDWQYFLDMNKLDPFVLLNIQDAAGQRNANFEDYRMKMIGTTKSIINVSKWDEYGIEFLQQGMRPEFGNIFIVQCMIGGEEFYIVVDVKKGRTSTGIGTTTYRYLGNIKMDEIINNKVAKENYKDYTSYILDPDPFIKGYTTFYQKIGFAAKDFKDSNFILNGLYLMTKDYKSIPTLKSETLTDADVRSIKMTYLYLNKDRVADTRKGYNEIKPTPAITAPDLKLKYSTRGAINNAMDLNIVNIRGVVKVQFGICGRFKHGYIPYYFPNHQDTSKVPFINENPFNTLINF